MTDEARWTVQIARAADRLRLRVWLQTQYRTPLSRTRLVLAAKAALAAVLAWYVAQLLLVGAEGYPYYAPLGALLATNFSVVSSIREAAQTVAAIFLGIAIAVAAQLVLGQSGWSLALVIGFGVLGAGWRRLGATASWVPASALFVLILSGDTGLISYIGSYGGLTLLGAVIGVLVNLAFPPLPLARFDALANRARRELADQLDDIGDGLDTEKDLSDQAWRQKTHDMRPLVTEVRAVTQETAEARRGNLRARWYGGQARAQYRHARLLERATFLTEELTRLITEGEREENRAYALGPSLHRPVARTLRSTAAVLREPDDAASEQARRSIAEAHRELRHLERAVEETRSETGGRMHHASAIVTSLRRILETAAPLSHRPSD